MNTPARDRGHSLGGKFRGGEERMSERCVPGTDGLQQTCRDIRQPVAGVLVPHWAAPAEARLPESAYQLEQIRQEGACPLAAGTIRDDAWRWRCGGAGQPGQLVSSSPVTWASGSAFRESRRSLRH